MKFLIIHRQIRQKYNSNRIEKVQISLFEIAFIDSQYLATSRLSSFQRNRNNFLTRSIGKPETL